MRSSRAAISDRATSGAFAVLTLRAIEKIRGGKMTTAEAVAHFEQVARTHRLHETGRYDPKLADMLIARVRQAAPHMGGKAIDGYRGVARRPADAFFGTAPIWQPQAQTRIHGAPTRKTILQR
jgi:hypothetical protein